MSLTRKLVLAFLAVSMVGVVLAVVLARWMTVREFNRLVIEQSQTVFIERAAAYYAEHGSWRGLAAYFRESPRPAYQVETRKPAAQIPKLPTFAFTLADQEGMVVVPGGPYKMAEQLTEGVITEGEPILVDGENVGTVIYSGKPIELGPQETHYLARTNQAAFYAAGGAALAALVLGILLARGLTSPLQELTGAIHKMADGELGTQVPVRSNDEIGELAKAFNQMSAELERLTAQRKQMTADIAHDLRTPLTVIGGYIEAMEDGVLTATPERLGTIQDEVAYLKRLVDDLRTLSLAEGGQLSINPVMIHPGTLLENAASAYALAAEEKGIRLKVRKSAGLPEIQADPDRMTQVINNLVDNALRHTPESGEITLGASHTANPVNSVLITVEDSGDGIPQEDLPRVFDRFYRGDRARSEDGGESGLGLAIAHSIIHMQGGKIWADTDGAGKGSTFTIRLPVCLS